MSRRLMFAEELIDASDGDPWRAVDLAIRVTRWRMIASREILPASDEVVPLGVLHARDRELVAA